MTLVHNLFVLNNIAALGAMSVLANQIGHFRLSVDADQLYEEALNIGKNMGLILAYTLNI